MAYTDDEEKCDAPLDVQKKPFCVIGPSVGRYNYARTWTSSADECVQHAQNLFRREKDKPTELYVVQVIKIIRVPTNVEVVDVKPGA